MLLRVPYYTLEPKILITQHILFVGGFVKIVNLQGMLSPCPAYMYIHVVDSGPPSTHSPYEEEEEEEEGIEDDNLPKKIRLEQQNHNPLEDLHNGEEYGFTLAHDDDSDQEDEQHETVENYENFEQQPPHQQQLEKATHNSLSGPELVNKVEVLQGQNEKLQKQRGTRDAMQNESPPPPVPPRSHSLSPSTSPTQTPFHDVAYGGRVDIYADNSSQEMMNNSNNTTTRPFLGPGRGGDMLASPPLPVNHTEARNAVTTVATPMSPDEETPPPLPLKRAQRRPAAASSPSQHLVDIREEEQALMSILDELERSISRTTQTASVGSKKNEAVPVINRAANQVSVGGSSEKL